MKPASRSLPTMTRLSTPGFRKGHDAGARFRRAAAERLEPEGCYAIPDAVAQSLHGGRCVGDADIEQKFVRGPETVAADRVQRSAFVASGIGAERSCRARRSRYYFADVRPARIRWARFRPALPVGRKERRSLPARAAICARPRPGRRCAQRGHRWGKPRDPGSRQQGRNIHWRAQISPIAPRLTRYPLRYCT